MELLTIQIEHLARWFAYPANHLFSYPFEIRKPAFVKHYLKQEGSFIGHYIQYNIVTRLREAQSNQHLENKDLKVRKPQ